jgi:hypothetical protein
MVDAMVLRAGSRARDDTTTTPPGFVAPVVAFNNPPALLDPAGSGVLGAVAERQPLPRHERLRRDTGPRAGGLQHSGAGATATGSQAAANPGRRDPEEIEMAKLATSLVNGGL